MQAMTTTRLTDSEDISLATVFATARGRVGMKHDHLAALMGISGPQLSQQLAGEGHVSLRRLLRIVHDDDGRAFLHALWSDLGDSIGVGDADPVMASLGQVVAAMGTFLGVAKLQMQRADLHHHTPARRTA